MRFVPDVVKNTHREERVDVRCITRLYNLICPVKEDIGQDRSDIRIAGSLWAG